MKTRRGRAVLIHGACWMLSLWGGLAAETGPAAAQSLTGTTGLVSIPTAEMPADGALAAGVNVLDARYNGHDFNGRFAGYAAMVQYASVGFLPFAEIGLRLTRLMDYPEPQALGDRAVVVRVRLLREGRLTPAVVVGGQDIVGTRIFHSLYIVVSKRAESVPVLGRVSVHAGYGDHLERLSAKSLQFQGIFGGISVEPRRWVALLIEHDAERINAGVRLRPWGGLAILAAVQGGDGLSGGISYTHRLK